MQHLQSYLFVFGEDRAVLSHRKDLIIDCINQGARVFIATKYGDHKKAIQSLGAQTIDLNINRTGLNPLSELLCCINLWFIVKRYKPTLIHLVGLKSSLIGSCAVLLSFYRPALVATLTGLGYLFLTFNKKINIIRYCVTLVLSLALQHLRAHVIVQNVDDLAFARDQLKLHPSKIHLIISSGVMIKPLDEHQKKSNNTRAKNSPMIALYMGRYLYDKGLNELAQAGAILQQRNCPAKIAIAGACDQKNPTSVEISQIENWQNQGYLEDWGHFIDPYDALYKANIAVLASYREGSPKFLAEAAASELPLIAFNVAGSNVICQHHISGLLVEPFDSTKLADAIEKLAIDKTLRDQLAAGAYKFACKQLDVQRINAQILLSFQQSIADHSQ